MLVLSRKLNETDCDRRRNRADGGQDRPQPGADRDRGPGHVSVFREEILPAALKAQRNAEAMAVVS